MRSKTDTHSCLSDVETITWALQRLPAAIAATVSQHLDGCAACQSRVAHAREEIAGVPLVHEAGDPVAPATLPTRDGDVPSLSRGTVLGRYVILDRVGGGGMGVVYAAYDPELDRKLAIKVLRRSTAPSRDDRLRLLREAQALARLRHAHIVGVYDVGTFREQVFVAMEFIAGDTMTRWLALQRRSWPEVLALFRQAGEALAAAHDGGIVHRDFKPDNVMVTREGTVRVLDFGLARATHNAATSEVEPRASTTHAAAMLVTPLTLSGSLLGTPLYMSPEQWLSQPADARSDQFSFCVALYEAFTGTRPFADDSLATLKRDVVDGRVRQWPIDCEAPLWIRTIVARGLRPRAEERYASLDELLAALAADPEAAHRRRRRLAALSVGSLVVATLASVGIVKGLHRPAQRCVGLDGALAGVWDGSRKRAVRSAFLATGRSYAAETAQRIERALDGYAQRWVQARTDSCRATYERGEQSEQLLDLRMACFDRRLGELGALTKVFAKGPDSEVLNNAVEAASHLSDLESCGATRTLEAVLPPPQDPASRATLAILRRRTDELKALTRAGKQAAALNLAQDLATATARLGYPPLHGDVLYRLGHLQAVGGREYRAAEQTLKEALQESAVGHDDQLAAHVWSELIYLIGYREARYDEANLLSAYAESAVQRAGNDAQAAANLDGNRAMVLWAQGRFGESQRLFERAIAAYRNLPDSSFDRAVLLDGLGLTLDAQAKYDLAERAYLGALALIDRDMGASHPLSATVAANLGNLLEHQGRYEEARRNYEHALTTAQNVMGPEHPDVALALLNLGNVLEDLGRHREARQILERASEVGQRVFPSGHPLIGATFNNLGDVLLATSQDADAKYEYERAIAVFERLSPQQLAYPLTGLARADLALGLPRQALRAAEQAVSIRAAEPDGKDLADSRFALARALSASRQPARVNALLEQARRGYSHAGNAGKKGLAELDAWAHAATPSPRRAGRSPSPVDKSGD